VGTNNGTTVAEVCVPNGAGWQDPTTQANARLIAAAPELLAALEYAFREQNTSGALSMECWDRARAAIANAKGDA
jgi:hypothetical protein